MSEILFYHLTRSGLEDALPPLLEKTLGKGWRAVVMASSRERVEALAAHLWTYKGDGFLPHGTAKDGNGPDQPIWITQGEDAPNKPEVLFLTDGASREDVAGFTRVCELFDGHDDAAVAAARSHWKTYKNAGHTLSYWQQEERGWTKTA